MKHAEVIDTLTEFKDLDENMLLFYQKTCDGLLLCLYHFTFQAIGTLYIFPRRT